MVIPVLRASYRALLSAMQFIQVRDMITSIIVAKIVCVFVSNLLSLELVLILYCL